MIASVSDFMLALVEVSFSVVYSRRGDGIKLSVRSEKSSLDAGKITAEALQGIGNGGGHAAMAGGFVPFTGSDGKAVILIDQIKERFFSTIAKRRYHRCRVCRAGGQQLEQSRKNASEAEPEERK